MEGVKVIDFAYVHRDTKETPSLRPQQPKNTVYFKLHSSSPPTPIDEIFLRDNKCFDDHLILLRKPLLRRPTRDEEERSRPENEIDSQFDPEDDYQSLTFPKTRSQSYYKHPVPELVQDDTSDEESDCTSTAIEKKQSQMTPLTATKLFKHDLSDPEDSNDESIVAPGTKATTKSQPEEQQEQQQQNKQQQQPRLLLGLLLYNTLFHTLKDLQTSTKHTLLHAQEYIKDAHILHHKHFPPSPPPIIPDRVEEERFKYQDAVYTDISQHQAIFQCVLGLILCLAVWLFSCVACVFGPRVMLQFGFVAFCLLARPDRCFQMGVKKGMVASGGSR